MIIEVNEIPSSTLYSESRPNLAKQSSYNNVPKILVVQECNVSFELNSDLVVQTVLNSVTITTQEEGHYRPFIIRKACVYKRSVKNELRAGSH